jgi:hypothetical protein
MYALNVTVQHDGSYFNRRMATAVPY